MKLLFAVVNLLFVVNVSCDVTSWRLPNTTFPIDYNILINVTSDNHFKISEIFSGIVEIRFKVVNSTTDIYLHTKFSNISQSDVTLEDINGQHISVGVKAFPDRELIYINVLNGILFENSVYTIKVYYSSKLRADKLGFHLTSYVDGSGRKM